jgi:hypothetical protein
MRSFRSWLFALIIPACLALAHAQTQAPKPEGDLSEEEIKHFLLTAKVVSEKETSKGVTHPSRLTLSDGRTTHAAQFQSVDISKTVETLDNGTTEIGFRDSYRFNIAAYELAKLLGLERMMPVTVERKYRGQPGSLTWWLTVKMDEEERLEKKIQPPDTDAWNSQMYRKLVFAELVCDSDPNLTNLLIGENWEIYMIDFSRAFRTHETIAHPKNLQHCDRQLLEKMRQLKQADVERAAGEHLTKRQIKALMARRDKIVDHFQQLVNEKGEAAVLY